MMIPWVNYIIKVWWLCSYVSSVYSYVYAIITIGMYIDVYTYVCDVNN